MTLAVVAIANCEASGIGTTHHIFRTRHNKGIIKAGQHFAEWWASLAEVGAHRDITFLYNLQVRVLG